jgi:hypothetical protein
MAISYLLAPIPKWVLINDQGTVAGGAKLYTYRSLNKTQPKAVYQDAGGTIPWTNPIIFDLNGVQGPFYWKVDSADLSDTYYLEAYDSDDNLLWTLDDYFPPGSGGGGNVTTYVPIQNYITNNQFIDHIDDTGNPTGVTDMVIAPSNHKGFTPADVNPVVGTYGVLGPDIRFVKNNTNATDEISFPLFPLASDPLTGDVTPVDYVRYQCTNTPTGETYKAFQFPITQKVKNLSNEDMTFKIWAKVTATPVTISIYVRQYFGSGTAASAEVRTLIDTIDLDTNWTSYNLSFTVPDVAGKSLGTPGQQTNDDALYIQIEMPLDAPCDVLFTKPALYLGTIDPSQNFDSYDQIDSVNQTPRTGNIKIGLVPYQTGGWIRMNDGSIGNVGSGATNRANQDTFQLYKTIWDSVINTWAPVSGGRGATAIADFIAGKTLTLPRLLGRALASAGAGAGLSNRALGQYLGEETHTLTTAELPNTLGTGVGVTNVTPSGAISVIRDNALGSGVLSQSGGGSAHTIMQPTSFQNFFIKL